MTTDQAGATVLEPEECWALLDQEEVGRLAVSVQNRPDIFPVNFIVDDGGIIMKTAEGTKLAASVLGVAVAFEIDGYDPEVGEAWSVVVKGPAREIETLQGQLDAFDLPLFHWQTSEKYRVIRIDPDEVTGRRFHVADRPQP